MGVPLTVREAPKAEPGREPYRILFPIGVAIGAVGVGLWIPHALGWTDYPGNAHAALLLLGFQQAFVLGFLMTAMPAFLHAPHCRPGELAAAVGLLLGGAVAILAGWSGIASLLYLGSLLVPVAMAIRRAAAGRAEAPPEEFLLVAAGVLTGIAGAAWSAGAAFGLWSEPAPRFGLRTIGLGMLLPLALGIGGLLVPTFMAMKDPLTIPGLARAHQRGPRRFLYAVLVLGFAVALTFEANGWAAGAAWLRAAIGSVILLWVWKLFRGPGRADRLSYSLWSAGWILLAGLWLSALAPARPLLGEHVVFLGGFGFLTMGIGTRVVVRHGGHPLEWEGRVLGTSVLVLLGAALLARAFSEGLDPAGASRVRVLAVAAACWLGAWGRWAWRAVPLARRNPAARDRVGAIPVPGPAAGATPPADLLVVFAGAQFRKEFAVRAWRAGAAPAIAIAVARFEWRRVPFLGLPGDGGLVARVEATPPRKRLFVILAEGGGADARVARKGPWGTWSEAKAFARIVRERGASRVLVCTSGYHVARARAALRRALDAEGVATSVALLPYPAPEPDISYMAPGRRGRSPRAWVSLLREGFKRMIYAMGVPMTFDPVSPPATPPDRGPSTRRSRPDP